MEEKKRTEENTLTKAQVFKTVKELTSKPFCAPGLVCDQCPLGCIEGLNDCALVYMARRLQELER
jgi:hypothetical protein